MHPLLGVLEWPDIARHLAGCCQTDYGRDWLERHLWSLSTHEALQAEQWRIEDAKTLLLRYGDPVLETPPEIRPTLKRLAKQGFLQSVDELAALRKGLSSLRELARFILQHRSKTDTPHLVILYAEHELPNATLEMLDGIVTSDGTLADSASPQYAYLKQQVQEARQRVQQQLNQLLHRPPFSAYVQEPIATQRDGRWVIPVKIEHKADVFGIVRDQSASGATVYIEPNSIVERNNRLAQLDRELAQEIQRILQQVSTRLFTSAPRMLDFVVETARVDALLAKARQSRRFDGNPIEILDDDRAIDLKQARHPLLLLQNVPVIPNDIAIRPPCRTLLVTGPNTGGKTVLLKLIGLCALMLQAGLHLPVQSGSRLFRFHPVLVDIGDPQSIAQNLSTFSGHMQRLKSFLDTPDLSSALILIDEICAGTDPQEGAALAEALLEAFHQAGAMAIVTTHIGALKLLGHQHHGYGNASVEFDPETLSPTYRLLMGVPGSSNALHIAARLGIAETITNRARERLVVTDTDAAQLIESLETKNRQLSEELETAQKLRTEIAWEETQLRQQLNRLEGEKRKTLQVYRQGIQHKLRVIEQELDDLRQQATKVSQRPDGQTVRQLRGRFKQLHAQTGTMFTEAQEQLYPNPGITWEQLHVGDTVTSRTLNLTGTILEKHSQQQALVIQSGILKTTIPLTDVIEAPVRPKSPKPKQRAASPREGMPHAPARGLSLECDVRGLQSDEAIAVMEKILDDAMVQNIASVHVIHGLGTGALKTALRRHLAELPYIAGYTPAEATDGGDGKTIVTLK